MPMKIKQADGSEIEVFTQQETEERINQEKERALEEYKASNPDKSQEVNELSNKLAEATRKLQEAEDANGNPEQIKRLREARDKAESERDGAIKKLSGDLENFKKESIQEVKDELMSRFSKGDKDLEKKIQFEFDRYLPNENSKSSIKERMEKAYQLATGNKPTPTVFDYIGGAGGNRGSGNTSQNNGNISENAKRIGNALGISEEQRKNAKEFLDKQKQGNNTIQHN